MKMQWISRQEEAELPRLNSQEEAVDYFEEKYGEKFVFEESIHTNEGLCFFYRLIIDEEAYINGASNLNANGTIGLDFMKSFQPIQIMEGGSIRIVH